MDSSNTKYDIEFSLLKTSSGMAVKGEYFQKTFGQLFASQSQTASTNLTAIAIFYKVSRKIAGQYIDLINVLNKSELTRIRHSVGIE